MRLSMMVILLGLVSCGGGSGSGGGNQSSTPVRESQSTDGTGTSTTSTTTTSENASFGIDVKRKTVLAEDRSNLEDFKADINSYNVKFKTLSGSFKSSEVVCQKTLFDGTKTSFYGAFDSVGFNAQVEVQIGANDPAEVEYDCSIKDRGAELDHAFVKIKKSYVISGKKNYSTFIAAESIGTLLLDKDAELSTDGAFVSLKMNDLISLGGKIVTFPQDRVNTTSDNRDGAPGGVINLEAVTAEGNLYVELRGLNGGKQTRSQDEKVLPPTRDASKDGKCSGYHHPSEKKCNGQQGPKGTRGKQGLTGHVGGDAGVFLFKTIENTLMKFDIKHFPGLGGIGGTGGEGSVGGPGGIGSQISWKEHKDGPHCAMCSPMDGLDNSNLMTTEKYKFNDGPQGEKGDIGLIGLTGANGNILQSKIVSEKGHSEFNFNYDWKNFN